MTDASKAGFTTAAVIASSLAAGVAVFWTVVWFLVDARGGPGDPGALTPALTLWIWGGLAVPGFVGALLLTRKARSVGEEARRRGLGIGSGAGGDDGGTSGSGRVPTRLILAWALLEGPALLAGVFFLLNGSRTLLAAAAPVYVAGVALTFPRRSWFASAAPPGPRREGTHDAP